MPAHGEPGHSMLAHEVLLLPVRSYMLNVDTPAQAHHAATSHASFTSISNLSFFPPSGCSSNITLKCFGTFLRPLTSFQINSGLR